MAQHQTLDALQRKKKHTKFQQLERNMSQGIHSKNNKGNIHQKTPQKPQDDKHQSQSIWPYQMSRSLACPPLSPNSKETTWPQNICPIHQTSQIIQLMLLILAKYAIWKAITCVIKKLYLNCFMQLKLRGKMCEIDNKTGVQQSNNKAPILFLYIIQRAIESLHPILPCSIPKFKYFPTQENAAKQLYGRLDLQPNPKSNRKNESSFQVNNPLYVADGTFLLKTFDELKVAPQTIHDHFSKFGLQMPTRTNKQKFKTETMYSPPFS